jgi:hypothetical protein
MPFNDTPTCADPSSETEGAWQEISREDTNSAGTILLPNLHDNNELIMNPRPMTRTVQPSSPQIEGCSEVSIGDV